MVGHAGNVQFEPGGRRYIMDDTDLVAGFLQYLALFNVHFCKALIGSRL